MSKCLEMLVNMVLYDSRDNYWNMKGSEKKMDHKS